MVLKNKTYFKNMSSSDQPVKKKLKITENDETQETSDEIDFKHIQPIDINRIQSTFEVNKLSSTNELNNLQTNQKQKNKLTFDKLPNNQLVDKFDVNKTNENRQETNELDKLNLTFETVPFDDVNKTQSTYCVNKFDKNDKVQSTKQLDKLKPTFDTNQEPSIFENTLDVNKLTNDSSINQSTFESNVDQQSIKRFENDNYDTTNLHCLELSLPTTDKQTSDKENLMKICNLRKQVLSHCENSSIPSTSSKFVENITQPICLENDSTTKSEQEYADDSTEDRLDLINFEKTILTQCLCKLNINSLYEILIIRYTSHETYFLINWNYTKLVQFLSNLQLLFDIYLKQNNAGYICENILSLCNYLIDNPDCLFEQIYELNNLDNSIVSFLASKVLASYFIIAKTSIYESWTKTILNDLITNNNQKLNFSINILKRILEWKDIDEHVLDEDQIITQDGERNISDFRGDCNRLTVTDSDSYDTSHIKYVLIKNLEKKWPSLIKNILRNSNFNREITISFIDDLSIINFLSLWENIISVKANLSVIDTKSFYANLDDFVYNLNEKLSPQIWRQLLTLFNEVLCYGSTLALQDMLPEEICSLAHLIVRCTKDRVFDTLPRIFDELPFKRNASYNSLIGEYDASYQANHLDKTLLQKMVLLVLKSIAITVKETRSDSSDSSIGSDDNEINQDMDIIKQSIMKVLENLDKFIKNSLDFHPECQFTYILVKLFQDQDDYLIESMVCTLDVVNGIVYRNSIFPDLFSKLNPINIFIEFLICVHYDSDVLLDYLVSNETCFLLYLLRFLKFCKKNWDEFVYYCQQHHSSNHSTLRPSSSRHNRVFALDNVMAVMIRLRLQIDRLVKSQKFPYNISPILRLLQDCENSYGGNGQI